ncbi:protein FAM13A [Caerostris extrusa]|uniref:Protein FAM13A n=1 Tax=Caerostris extrusa TaxID=172846 RepID=A0AAV4UHN9_CAEEX|nr:protein FAM13A [Caerostris extrusa]
MQVRLNVKPTSLGENDAIGFAQAILMATLPGYLPIILYFRVCLFVFNILQQRSGSMRAPFCNDSTDLSPDEKGIIHSEEENEREIHSIERSLVRSHCNKTSVFGICLDKLMGTTARVTPQIPYILSRLCRYIETYGLHCKNLFLEGDVKSVVENLKVEFSECGDASLESANDSASVAKLLIVFFEELPEPLIPDFVQSNLIKDMEKLSLKSEKCISHLKFNVVLSFSGRIQKKILFTQLKHIVNYFVQDYHAIFEDDVNAVSKCSKTSRQLACPPCVASVVSLSPLSVVIPSEDTSNNNAINVPALLIEGQAEMSITENKISGTLTKTNMKAITTTRKRKERRFSGEDSQPRSSSEERPNSNSLLSLEGVEIIRRCNSHEEVMDESKPYGEVNMLSRKAMDKGMLHIM